MTLCSPVWALMVAGKAYAAQQGDQGPVSTGSIAISVTVAPKAWLEGATDIAIEEEKRDGVDLKRKLCLTSNFPRSTYGLRAFRGAGMHLLQAESNFNSLDYEIGLSSTIEGSIAASGGSVETVAAAEANCPDGVGAVDLIVSPLPFQLLVSGKGETHTGSLTLIVAPN